MWLLLFNYMTTKSLVTVSVQLICIAALVMTGPIIPHRPTLFVLACAGAGLIVWAFAVMGFYNVRIEPEVSEHARLVTTGPYRFVRHPMYTGGALVTLAWLWNDFSAVRLAVWLVLMADLMVKLRYEERLLMKRFPLYGGYARRTKRLIPFMY